jgi:predicted DNA binding CopG/RHH family protein
MKNNIDLTLFVMKKKGIKRINLWVDEDLFKQIKSKADEAYLKVATFTRQLIQQAMKNNSIKNK